VNAETIAVAIVIPATVRPRDRAGRNVDVEGLLLERLAADPELGRVGPIHDRPARAIRHDLAKLAGEDEVLLAVIR